MDDSPAGCERRYASSSPSSNPAGSSHATRSRADPCTTPGRVTSLGKTAVPVTISTPPRRLALPIAGSGPTFLGCDLHAALTRLERGRSSERRAAAAAARSSGRGIGHRATPERAAVVGAEIGVSHDQAHGVDRRSELRSDEQRERRAVALTDVDLAGEGGDGPVGVDMEPGAGARRPAPQARRRRQGRPAAPRTSRARRRERDPKASPADRTAALAVVAEPPASRPCSSAARRTALTIRE